MALRSVASEDLSSKSDFDRVDQATVRTMSQSRLTKKVGSPEKAAVESMIAVIPIFGFNCDIFSHHTPFHALNYPRQSLSTRPAIDARYLPRVDR